MLRLVPVCLWITEFQSLSERSELEIMGLVVYSRQLLSTVTINAMVNMSENSNLNIYVNEQNNNSVISPSSNQVLVSYSLDAFSCVFV